MKKYIKFTIFAYKEKVFEPDIRIHGKVVCIDPNEIIGIRESGATNESEVKKVTVNMSSNGDKKELQVIPFSLIDIDRFSYAVAEDVDTILKRIEDFYKENPHY